MLLLPPHLRSQGQILLLLLQCLAGVAKDTVATQRKSNNQVRTPLPKELLSFTFHSFSMFSEFRRAHSNLCLGKEKKKRCRHTHTPPPTHTNTQHTHRHNLNTPTQTQQQLQQHDCHHPDYPSLHIPLQFFRLCCPNPAILQSWERMLPHK